MVRRHVATEFGLADNSGEELICDVLAQQALAVLGERRRVKGGCVDRQVKEPLEQHVVVEAFAERPL
jgi:hypothetical protein